MPWRMLQVLLMTSDFFFFSLNESLLIPIAQGLPLPIPTLYTSTSLQGSFCFSKLHIMKENN